MQLEFPPIPFRDGNGDSSAFVVVLVSALEFPPIPFRDGNYTARYASNASGRVRIPPNPFQGWKLSQSDLVTARSSRQLEFPPIPFRDGNSPLTYTCRFGFQLEFPPIPFRDGNVVSVDGLSPGGELEFPPIPFRDGNMEPEQGSVIGHLIVRIPPNPFQGWKRV